jgi:hypothetical protein
MTLLLLGQGTRTRLRWAQSSRRCVGSPPFTHSAPLPHMHTEPVFPVCRPLLPLSTMRPQLRASEPTSTQRVPSKLQRPLQHVLVSQLNLMPAMLR